MSDIVLIVPSRGRPGAIAELIEAIHDYTEWADYPVDLVVAIDNDDPRRDEYRALVPDLPPWAMIRVGPRLRLGPTLNEAALRVANAAPPGTIIGFMGDDHRPRTPYWNIEIGTALASAPGVAYGNDLVHGAGLPTAAFISAEIVRQLGYFVPPGIIHLFADDAWKAIGQATNLHYLPDVVIEHLHPIVGKAEWDEGYRENNSEETWAHDQAVFSTWLASDWQSALQ